MSQKMLYQSLGLTAEQYEQFCYIWNFAKAFTFLLDLSPEQMERIAHLFEPLDIYELQRWARKLRQTRLDRDVWTI